MHLDPLCANKWSSKIMPPWITNQWEKYALTINPVPLNGWWVHTFHIGWCFMVAQLEDNFLAHRSSKCMVVESWCMFMDFFYYFVYFGVSLFLNSCFLCWFLLTPYPFLYIAYRLNYIICTLKGAASLVWNKGYKQAPLFMLNYLLFSSWWFWFVANRIKVVTNMLE